MERDHESTQIKCYIQPFISAFQILPLAFIKFVPNPLNRVRSFSQPTVITFQKQLLPIAYSIRSTLNRTQATCSLYSIRTCMRFLACHFAMLSLNTPRCIKYFCSLGFHFSVDIVKARRLYRLVLFSVNVESTF